MLPTLGSACFWHRQQLDNAMGMDGRTARDDDFRLINSVPRTKAGLKYDIVLLDQSSTSRVGYDRTT